MHYLEKQLFLFSFFGFNQEFLHYLVLMLLLKLAETILFLEFLFNFLDHVRIQSLLLLRFSSSLLSVLFDLLVPTCFLDHFQVPCGFCSFLLPFIEHLAL
jgi:hypothetical protein